MQSQERTCIRCGSYFQSIADARVCGPCRDHPAPKEQSRKLSFREKQLIKLVAQAKLNKEIAYELRLTEGTVKEYMHRIFLKTGCANRTALAMWWLQGAEVSTK
jgi:DNA-binding NarL/FixJ family response regulator